MKLARSVMWLSLLGLLIFTTTTSANAQNPKWFHGAKGFARAVELQRESRASMVVYFYTDWCPYCRTLDDEYLSAPSVRRVLERTVAVRINPEGGPAERQLANRYGVTGYPTFFIMNNESARPRELQPFRKGGNHLTPQQFAQACEEVIRFVPSSAKSTRPDESAESLESASNRAVMNATRQTRGVQIVEVPRAAPAAPAKIKSNPLPAIDVILSKYVDAIGGKEGHEKFNSRVIKGRFELSGAEWWGQLTISAKAPNKSLSILNVQPMGQIKHGFDGDAAWNAGDSTNFHTLTRVALSRFSTDTDFHREIKLSKLYPGIRVIGTVKEKDREFYLVEGFAPFGSEEMMYFDTQTGLLTGRDLTQQTPQGPTRVAIRYSDWRNVGGVKLPFKIIQSMANVKFVFTVTEVKHNLVLDDKLFAKP